MGRNNDPVSSGTTFLASCIILLLINMHLGAQSFTPLHTFTGSSADGYYPSSDLVLDGNTLYGTTPSGGRGGNGTAFKINTDGTAYTAIKYFTNNEGANPYTGMVCSNGVLYGTTESGGTAFNGTIFRMNTNGAGYTVLKGFPAMNPTSFGTNNDGAQPRGALVFDGNSLYGTTYFGGAYGNGTVFKINTDGSGFTTLKTFSSLVNLTNSDGAGPTAGLVLCNSMLYGTTFHGGTGSNGVVFCIGTDGSGFSVLKNFSELTYPPGMNFGTNSDGANPKAALTLIGDTLYGTTVNGGSLYNGTVFKLKTNGTDFVVLKNFENADGAWPQTLLAMDGQTLYGTTIGGGNTNQGVLFRVFTNGANYTVLKYLSPAEGNYIYAGLVLSGNKLYGVARYGGPKGLGALFSFLVPPQIIANGGVCITSNSFGFNVTGISNQTVVVEASPDLTVTNWVPMQTNILNGGPDHISDVQWTNGSQKFYRLRVP